MNLTTSGSTSGFPNLSVYSTHERPVEMSTVFTPPPECSTRPFTNPPRLFDWDEPMWDTYIYSKVTTSTLSCWPPEYLSRRAVEVVGPCPHGYTTIGTRDKTDYRKDSMLWYTTAYCCPPWVLLLSHTHKFSPVRHGKPRSFANYGFENSNFKGGTWARFDDFMCSTMLDPDVEYAMIEYDIRYSSFTSETIGTVTVNRKSTMALDRGYLAVWNSALLPLFTPPSAPVLNKESVPSRPPVRPYNFDPSSPYPDSGASTRLAPRFIAAIVSSVVGTIIIIITTWWGLAIRRKKKREAAQMSEQMQQPQVIYVPVYVQQPPGHSQPAQQGQN